MNVASEYLFGKGKVAIAERAANGSISELFYVGNCPELKISGNVDKVDHYESQSGLNTKDRSLVKSAAFEFSMTLESISEDNLALITWGTKQDIAAAAGQNYTFPNPVAADETHVIPNAFNLSNLVLKDSTGTPLTVDTADYEADASFGVVKFIDVSGYVQPIKAQFDQGAAKAVPAFTGERPARFIRFEGLNLGNPGSGFAQKVLVEIYNGAFDLPSDISFIGDDFGKFELKGDINKDDTRAGNSALGGYFRIVKF
jgi:hypothetical protein